MGDHVDVPGSMFRHITPVEAGTTRLPVALASQLLTAAQPPAPLAQAT